MLLTMECLKDVDEYMFLQNMILRNGITCPSIFCKTVLLHELFQYLLQKKMLRNMNFLLVTIRMLYLKILANKLR
ncbi:Uncharacterised protein [Chlamydia trachomatis]|nr:Uncharacterised protein [Chlamydia trachomatis]